MIEESRTKAERFIRAGLRVVRVFFLVSLILGLANAPLILAWQNIVSPLGVVLGPPLILLTSIALIFGFLSWRRRSERGSPGRLRGVTEMSLAGCEVLVHGGELIPGGWVYAPGPPTIWLVGFYLARCRAGIAPSPWSNSS